MIAYLLLLFAVFSWANNLFSDNLSQIPYCQIEELFRHPVIMMKRSKSGDKETDITTLIRSVSAEWADGELVVTAVTSAQSENYLNPEYVAQAIDNAFAVSGERGWHVICRHKLMLEDGSDFE